MTDKKEHKATKAGTVELDEADLDQVTGGGLDHVGNYNFKVEINGVKEELTRETGIRVNKKIGIRATNFSKTDGSSDI